MMLHSLFRGAVLGAILAGTAACPAGAASFELARRPDGTIIPGLRMEGEIVAGDAQRLLDFYGKYGTFSSPVYLRSRGGDVEEAMRMGSIIRRLRLETKVPVWDAGKEPVDLIKVDRPEDTLCASACFLVYAAGASRMGNYLALNRPYLPREGARSLTDVEYEALQKEMAPKVRAYLADMEVDQYWIDRMFAANSQESYMPSWAEADNKARHLMGLAPSLEEVVLSKCKEDPDVDRKLQAFRASKGGRLTPADLDEMKRIMQEADVFYECEKTVLSDMRNAAFNRENEPALAAKCGPAIPVLPSEIAELETLSAKGGNVTPQQVVRNQALLAKYSPARCRSGALFDLSMAAIRRWAQDSERDKPKPSVAEDFDAKGLSPADMARRGKAAYEAERWDVAERWFRKATDLGDADGMMGMSWIYGNGRGVLENGAEAMRWRRMAAEHGSAAAMNSIAYAYAQGKEVPQDYAEAIKWYRKAADAGNRDALRDIGDLYGNGQGVAQDYAEAIRWYRKAADAGDAMAMFQIGMMHDLGNGVPKDEEQARAWMKKAAVSDGDTLGKIAANDWLMEHPAP